MYIKASNPDELIASLQTELAEARRLRDFDTGVTPLPKGLVLEHARLDSMWQKLVRDLAEARRKLEQIKKAICATCDRPLWRVDGCYGCDLDAQRTVIQGLVEALGKDYNVFTQVAMLIDGWNATEAEWSEWDRSVRTMVTERMVAARAALVAAKRLEER